MNKTYTGRIASLRGNLKKENVLYLIIDEISDLDCGIVLKVIELKDINMHKESNIESYYRYYFVRQISIEFDSMNDYLNSFKK